MTLSLYRFIAVAGRKLVIANVLGFLTMVIVILLGGFIITKGNKYSSSHFSDILLLLHFLDSGAFFNLIPESY